MKLFQDRSFIPLILLIRQIFSRDITGYFEYQTYIAILTGMDVSNASLYDGATSLVEASNMAVNITRKNKILVDRFVHQIILKFYRLMQNLLI